MWRVALRFELTLLHQINEHPLQGREQPPAPLAFEGDLNSHGRLWLCSHGAVPASCFRRAHALGPEGCPG